MSELTDAIDAAVDEAERTTELKQAHALMVQARALLRRAEWLLEAPGDDYADELEASVANGLEAVMWRVETAIRKRAAG